LIVLCVSCDYRSYLNDYTFAILTPRTYNSAKETLGHTA
jgi:hypothetical protein